MSYIDDGFYFEKESDVSRTNLILSLKEDDKINKLQMDMIEQNPNKSIIPMSLRIKDSQTKIFYDITSKNEFKYILSTDKLKKSEFLGVIYNITKVLDECKNYFGKEENFIIHEDYIYIEKSTLEVSMIYVPIEFEIDFKEEFKIFIRRVLDDLLNIEEKFDLGYMERIRIYLKDPAFNITGFNKLIQELNIGAPAFNQGSNKIDSPIQIKSPEYLDDSTTSNSKNEIHNNQKINNQSSNNEIENSKAAKNKFTIPGGKTYKETKVTKKTKNEVRSISKTELKHSKKNVILGVTLQFIIIVLIIVIYLTQFKNSGDTTRVLGLILIFGAIDFLIMRKIFDQSKKVEVQVTEIVKQEKQNKTKETRKEEKKEIKTKTNSSNNVINIPKKTNSNDLNMQSNKIKTSNEENLHMEQREEKELKEQKEHKKLDAASIEEADSIDTSKEDESKVDYSIEKSNKSDLPQSGVENNLEQQDINSKVDIEPTGFLNGLDPNATMLMNQDSKPRPYFKCDIDGAPTTITITNNKFSIGRNESKVDYVIDQNKISRIHMEIIIKNNKYFVIDKKSSNGTYVNLKKIDANLEYEIFSDDKIKIANIEMAFIIP